MNITKELFEKKELLGKSAIIHTRFRYGTDRYDTVQDTYLVDVYHNSIEYDYNKVHYVCHGRNICVEYKDNPEYRTGDNPWFDIIASEECYMFERDFDNNDCWIEILPKEEVLSKLHERVNKFFNK